MKISIDGILSSADRIKNQRKLDDENLSNSKKEIKSDSLTIESRISSRLDRIDRDFREIQSSLTKNQIIKEGITLLEKDLARGGEKQKDILNETKFEGNTVLRSFVGESITSQLLKNKSGIIDESIQENVLKLKNLQVELDNLIASNLTGKEKPFNIQTDIDSIFTSKIKGNIDSISSLKADTVMRLIK